jgi:dihydroorotate dehydrogenase (fumarate)
MDLTTKYMGLTLKNPIIVSSSRLTRTLSSVQKCAEHGAGAVVLKSLFEEQILADKGKLIEQESMYFWFPEAIDHINNIAKEQGVSEYLTLIREAKKSISIPLIASINCVSSKEWPAFAQRIEEAGADAIELNIAIFPYNSDLSSEAIESVYMEIVQEVKKHTQIPVSVKLGPCFTNLHSLCEGLSHAGADALVLFNRFYRPDINIDDLTLISDNYYSAPEEIGQSLRWVALLSKEIDCDFAAATGIHDYSGIVKQILAGADATQVCTSLFKNGVAYMDTMLDDLKGWMAKHNYNSIADFKGKVAAGNAAFERVQYMKKSTDQ